MLNTTRWRRPSKSGYDHHPIWWRFWLRVDVRDGFMLAVKTANRSDLEVIVEDDARKPALAVQIADKMIQKKKWISSLALFGQIWPWPLCQAQ